MQTAPRPYGGDVGRTDGHSLCKRHQDRTVATSNGIKTVRWRRRTDEHSLCKRHQDRTVATSNGRTNVNASSVLLLRRRKAGMLSRIALGKQAVHFAES